MPADLSIRAVLAGSRFRDCALAVETPVPLERADLLSKDLGRRIYIKREDRVDDLGCGNKLRKLHYVLHDAREAGIDTLITLGSLPSNQCKAVARMAKQNGMQAHLVYGGDVQQRPASAHGSYLLASLFDPRISWFERTPWPELEAKLTGIHDAEVDAGRSPLIIRSGVSHWPGMIGSLELALETARQLREQGKDKVDIVCTAGSGGTAVGFQLAAELFGLDHAVHGICIGEPSAGLAAKTEMLAQEAYDALGLARRAATPLHLHDVAIGRAYDQPDDGELAIMKEGVSRYGLLLDPNYMLKTFIGLRHLVRHDRMRKDAATVMIHTGGQLGLFDNNRDMTSWHRREYPDWITAEMGVGS
jgi:1-aminocyclopropane-1-carboxylate deaminase/D-cysteine desulfhydrase-like pyridoxal-dependent ACC family enzyme